MSIRDRVIRSVMRSLCELLEKADSIDYLTSLMDEARLRGITRGFRNVGTNCYIGYPWNCIVGGREIEIGDNFHANKGLFLGAYGEGKAAPKILIGDDVLINYDSQITAIDRIVIGDDVLTGSRIFISDHSHGEIRREALAEPPLKRPLYSRGPVIIGNRVWIGSGVAILPGVTIGDDCIIGANSVVTKPFPPRSVIAGNPARLLRVLE